MGVILGDELQQLSNELGVRMSEIGSAREASLSSTKDRAEFAVFVAVDALKFSEAYSVTSTAAYLRVYVGTGGVTELAMRRALAHKAALSD